MPKTYTPPESERERVRAFIHENSGWKYRGMRRLDYKPATYPRGIASFAEQVGLTRVTVSKALNGHPTSLRTWQKIVSEVNCYQREDELMRELAKIRGVSIGQIEKALASVA